MSFTERIYAGAVVRDLRSKEEYSIFQRLLRDCEW
jgi:hypothetical protein